MQITTQLPAYGNLASLYYTGNGATTDYTISFDYIGKSSWSGTKTDQVRVYTGDTWEVMNEDTTWTQPAAGTVRFGAAPANGKKILVRRDSKLNTALLDFVDGSRLTAAQLDLLYQQNLYSLQETYDRINNLSLAVQNFAQSTTEYNFTGNGATTTYSLNPEVGLNDNLVIVFLAGIRQPTTAYNVSDSGGFSQVVFTVAPSNGIAISVVVLRSVALIAAIGANSVGNSAIQNSAVTFGKTNFNGAGSNGTFLGQSAGTATWLALAAANISDFNTAVRTNRIDQLAAAGANVSMGNYKITNVGTPVSGSDATNKTYVDSAVTTQLSSAIDAGRVVSGTYTAGASWTSVTLGWRPDMLICFPDYAFTNGVRGIAPEYRYQYPENGNPTNKIAIGFEPIIYPHWYVTPTWQIQSKTDGYPATNEGRIQLDMLSTGFRHKLLTGTGGNPGATTREFFYIAIKNSTVA